MSHQDHDATEAHAPDDGRCSGYQLARPHRPARIVPATTAEQVRQAVVDAAARGVPYAVQATGHGRRAPLDGGVLISTTRMNGVRVDACTRTARVQAGATWARVIEAAAPHGLAPPNGSAPGVGVTGYLLGGGLGILAREQGWAADHVRALDVVTGDGAALRVTAHSEPELFWALRGGGSGLGVAVTGLEIGLASVARVWGGQLVFGADRLPDLLRAYPDWARSVPDALTSSLALLVYPDLPVVPAALRGRHVGQVRLAWTGAPEEGERLVAPLRAVGPRLADRLAGMPYAASHTVHSDPDRPHAYDGDNVLLDGLDADALAAVAEEAGPAAPMRCVVQLNPLGGALSRPPRVPNAVGFRGARHLLRLLSPLDGTDTRAVRALHRRLLGLVAPWALGRSPNFVFGDHPGDPARPEHEPDAAARLERLRRALP
ncbi:FAD-binding oxidoreductase [Streptomyces sp. DSM 42041]|uniref:FAD-binding oxidoreductase n=1 Tax=Streptomyces hazeniae TaxID=3075538 RepID=A0ABU2NWC9_9ACTN|nr:FAD-binding oxidoreductase [Streptomyces sp. DSM 42041]MDT0381297.1 FAD-binding oxidoreductase [Streptomyces sp. DSM 42041]